LLLFFFGNASGSTRNRLEVSHRTFHCTRTFARGWVY
jgi:hypothetical protein